MYIWHKEVESINGLTVSFTDWTSHEYTKRQLEYVQTDEPKDATEYRTHILEHMVIDIINVMKEHNIENKNVWALFEFVKQTHSKAYNDAIGKAFGTYVEWEWPTTQLEEITMRDIERVSKG